MNEIFPKPFRRFLESFGAEYRRLRASAGAGQRAPLGQRGENDFAGHAAYVAGDDLRHVDWHAFGRSDRLFLKIFQAEQSRDLRLLLDTSASMGSNESPEGFAKRQFALQIAALLGATALSLRIPFSLMAKSARHEFQGTREIPKLLHVLESLNFGAEINYWSNRLSERALEAKGARNLVVISDCLEEVDVRKAIAALSARSRELWLIATLGASEAKPAVASFSGALKLTDAESGRALETFVDAAALHAYQKELAAHFAPWAAAARAKEATFTLVDGSRAVPDLARELFFSSGSGGGSTQEGSLL